MACTHWALISLACVSLPLLVIGQTPREHDCLCSDGTEDFAMACANSTCQWGWCQCSNEHLCDNPGSCEDISCVCFDHTSGPPFTIVSVYCVMDQNLTISCSTCDSASREIISASNVSGLLKPGDVFSHAAGHMSAYRQREIWEYGIARSHTQGRIEETVFSLRRGISCVQRLLDTCAGSIKQDECLPGTTTNRGGAGTTTNRGGDVSTTAKPDGDVTIPTQCDTNAGQLVGIFAGGFALAVLLVLVFFICYHIRIKRSEKSLDYEYPPEHPYDVIGRVRNTFLSRQRGESNPRYQGSPPPPVPISTHPTPTPAPRPLWTLSDQSHNAPSDSITAKSSEHAPSAGIGESSTNRTSDSTGVSKSRPTSEHAPSAGIGESSTDWTSDSTGVSKNRPTSEHAPSAGFGESSTDRKSDSAGALSDHEYLILEKTS